MYLLPFALGETVDLLRGTVRQFAENEITPIAAGHLSKENTKSCNACTRYVTNRQ